MGRKAARLERAGALTPRDLMWAAIRLFEGHFSALEIHLLVNARRAPEQQLAIETVEQYLEGLSRAKPAYVALLGQNDEAGRKRSELWLWRLMRDVGVDAPRVTRDGKPVTQGAANEALWLAMKTLKEFDCRELAGAASAGAVKVGLNTARMYCYWLAFGGYLVIVHRGHGGAASRYRFVRSRDTGPRAPLVTSEHDVIDANTGAVAYQAPREAGRK